MRKILKIGLKCLNIIFMVFLGLLVVANLYTFAAKKITGELQPTVFGYSSAVVISGSMADRIEVNDMIVTHKTGKYAVGDIITFESNASLVTHRIIEETEQGFRTKGDANNTADDALVKEDQIVGKVVLVIPKVGSVIGFLQTPLGMLLLIFTALLLLELPVFLKRRKDANFAEETEKQ